MLTVANMIENKLISICDVLNDGQILGINRVEKYVLVYREENKGMQRRTFSSMKRFLFELPLVTSFIVRNDLIIMFFVY
jgi:hypothetical protein